MIELPNIFRLRQHFDADSIADIGTVVRAQLDKVGVSNHVRPGETVAITAGSRGIANIVTILRSIVEYLDALDAQPFLVPAMGSHGGATAQGQTDVLAGYGITSEAVGCPIHASMETVVVAQAAAGFPIHFDQHAHGADHVIVCGRVKPHTDFAGRFQSGLAKMLAKIGLGKYNGARAYHRAAQTHGFDQIIEDVTPRVLASCNVLAGLAIVENALDETSHIAGVAPADFLAREPQLLALATRSMAKLPFDHCDVLIIDEIGKNISGTGFDTNVVGRKLRYHGAGENEFPQVRRIVLRGLTTQSHGNAVGLGLAEFCHSRIVKSMDQRATFLNGITSGNVAAAMIPVHFDTDQELIEAALATIGMVSPTDARLLWIRNTLDLSEIECSDAYLAETSQRDDLQALTPPRPLPLGSDGNLPSIAQLG